MSRPISLIAPFWIDLNPSNGGNISYRKTSDSELLQRVSSLVQLVNSGNLASFVPTQLFIATWYQVPRYGSPSEVCPFKL